LLEGENINDASCRCIGAPKSQVLYILSAVLSTIIMGFVRSMRIQIKDELWSVAENAHDHSITHLVRLFELQSHECFCIHKVL